ncbi:MULTISPECIES: hypothetical protein [unclassified Asaia]|nr:hypothetical protein [Asaia sp. W19]
MNNVERTPARKRSQDLLCIKSPNDTSMTCCQLVVSIMLNVAPALDTT